MKFKSGDVIKRTQGPNYTRILLKRDTSWFILRPTMQKAPEFDSVNIKDFDVDWEKVGNIHEVLKEVEEEDEQHQT